MLHQREFIDTRSVESPIDSINQFYSFNRQIILSPKTPLNIRENIGLATVVIRPCLFPSNRETCAIRVLPNTARDKMTASKL